VLNLTLERIERQIRYLPVKHVYVLCGWPTGRNSHT
jgi:hypothetical protein